MRRTLFLLAICLLFTFMMMPVLVTGQSAGVTAEPLGQANLRAEPNVEAALVGEVLAGTRYPVIGRSEFFPWLLLGDPATMQPMGWVFRDLVNVLGDVNQVPFSTMVVGQSPVPVTLTFNVSDPGPTSDSTLPPNVTPGAAAAGGNVEGSAPAAPTQPPTVSFSVSGVARGEINIRYGPGVDFPPLGRAFAGDTFELTAYHTQFPWVQVRYETSPNGYAWVATDLLEITGDRFSLPAIAQSNFNLPQLTPTPSLLQSSGLPGQEQVELSPEFAALGNELWNQILEAGYVPETSRFGALYIQDLQTGEAITFGHNIAFSGTSISKIAILIEYFRVISGTPNLSEAADIANTMICSENVATNKMLGVIGSGDQLQGAEDTTTFLQELGIERTFLTAPFDTTTTLATSTPVPRPIRAPSTSADQTRANPNPTNQMTVEEMGWLLGAVYQCAYNEGGILIEQFGDAFTPQECRKIMHVMSNNTVDALLKAGVPEDIRVAHKHGWINDTHGNAAVMFTPGGDYVLVMMLHQPSWLVFTDSLPVIAEVSRTVFNYYNPDRPLDEVREGYIPGVDECNYTVENPLVAELASPTFLSTLDTSLFYNPDMASTPDAIDDAEGG